MQARVTCPVCQTTLGVNPSHGDGTVLRCPKCRHEFAIRLRTQSAAPPAMDPLAGLTQDMAPHPPYNAPLASRPAQSVRPPAHLATTNSGPSASLLWIGIAGGAALVVAAIVLVAIFMHVASPANHRDDAGQNLANATPPAGQAPAMPPPVASGTDLANSAQPATSAAGPVSSSAPASSQPVVSVAPGSTLPPSPAPAPAAAPAPLLSYRFNAGEEYAYSFTVKADIAGNADQSSGRCTLSLSREAAPAEFASEQRGQGSGSGFVVTPDGYIVTCAHVVEGSTKLEAVLGTQTYPAQVMAFDKEHDLAVIRIIASNLPTVSLANSDMVQLAEEVRAVGYPLSNLLGESVKITRGTIAGVVNTSGHKLFQVDASINPGNSGGPMVNEMGQVVGVASAKLAREDIDGVGFAVPASDVLALLRSKGISLAAAAPAQKLDGPSLARRVTPAVAMIKVTIGPGGYGAANRLVLDFSGHVTTSGPSHSVGRIRMPGIPSTESDRGKLLLSERGELLEVNGNIVQLPFLLGRLSTLAIEPFAGDDKRNWQTQRATVLTQIVGQESQSPLSMRFRHRGRSPFGQSPFGQNQTKVIVTPAMETCGYDLSSMNGDLATITKRYTFQTLDPAGAPPTAKVTGEGTMTFNRAKGYAEKMEYKATLVRSVSNVTITVPMTLEWHRLSQGELDLLRAQAQANQEAAKKAHEERTAQAAKKNIGEETEFVGGSTGFAKRTIDDNSLLYGVECGFGEWGREQCLKEVAPIFSRGQELKKPGGAVAREGYAVGAVNVQAGSYVNAIQLVFMRVKDDGRLNAQDSYTSPWIGVRSKDKPRTLTGNGDPIIGISVRQGLVCDALALVVNRKPKEK